jgi:hypothetical protein
MSCINKSMPCCVPRASVASVPECRQPNRAEQSMLIEFLTRYIFCLQEIGLYIEESLQATHAADAHSLAMTSKNMRVPTWSSSSADEDAWAHLPCHWLSLLAVLRT